MHGFASDPFSQMALPKGTNRILIKRPDFGA